MNVDEHNMNLNIKFELANVHDSMCLRGRKEGRGCKSIADRRYESMKYEPEKRNKIEKAIASL